MISHTFSAEDITKLHNGISYLHHFLDKLRPILSEQMIEQGNKSLDRLTEGMKGYYVAEEEFRKTEDARFNTIETEFGPFVSIWSVGGITSEKMKSLYPQPVLTVSYQGRSIPVSPTRPPSWLELWIAADTLIRLSGDNHHVFIEEFVYNSESQDLALYCGS